MYLESLTMILYSWVKSLSGRLIEPRTPGWVVEVMPEWVSKAARPA